MRLVPHESALGCTCLAVMRLSPPPHAQTHSPTSRNHANTQSAYNYGFLTGSETGFEGLQPCKGPEIAFEGFRLHANALGVEPLCIDSSTSSVFAFSLQRAGLSLAGM